MIMYERCKKIIDKMYNDRSGVQFGLTSQKYNQNLLITSAVKEIKVKLIHRLKAGILYNPKIEQRDQNDFRKYVL